MRPTTRPPGRARTSAVVATVAVACLLLAAHAVSPAAPDAAADTAEGSAQPDAAQIGLEAITGYGSDSAQGSWLPVEVRLSPSRPVAGELSIESHSTGSPVAVSRDIEVAAGANSVHRALVPTGRIRVSFDEDGGDPVTVEPALQAGRDDILAGWLSDGGLPAQLPRLRLEPLGQRLDWVALHPEWLDASPFALEPLGTVVSDTSTLVGLPEPARRNLVTALSMGGHLVVIAEPGDPLDSLGDVLPDGAPATAAEPAEVTHGDPLEVASLDPADGAWTLDAADAGLGGDAVLAAASDVGRGRVVVVGASPAGPLGDVTALWEETLGPGRIGGAYGAQLRRAGGPGVNLASVLRTDDESVPALPGLAAFLAVYVLVVGPVNGIALKRMGRRELAWVTVPVVTVVFTVAAFAGAVRGGDSTGVTGTAQWWIDGHGGEVVAAGSQPPTAGTHEVAVHGPGWIAHPQAPSQAATVSGDDPLAATVDLEAFELGGLIAWRALDADPPLELEATATRLGVDVVARNGSDRPLRDIIVHAGAASTHLGELSPGESAEVMLQVTGIPRLRDPTIRPGETLPQSMEAALIAGIPISQPGLVWATATDDGDAGESVTVDGRSPRDGGRLVAVGARAGTDPQAPASQALLRDLFATDDEELMHDSHSAEALLRFRLPAGSSPEELRPITSRDAAPQMELAAWDRTDRRWVDIDDAVDAERFVSPLGQVLIRTVGGAEGEHTGTTLSGTAEEVGT